jgi:uncharacterized protein (DUF2237 family)
MLRVSDIYVEGLCSTHSRDAAEMPMAILGAAHPVDYRVAELNDNDTRQPPKSFHCTRPCKRQGKLIISLVRHPKRRLFAHRPCRIAGMASLVATLPKGSCFTLG